MNALIDFPSIYLEYLIINHILYGRPKGIEHLNDNLSYIFRQLAREQSNPLFITVIDPANTNNVLSDLLAKQEKDRIIYNAKTVVPPRTWKEIMQL